MWKSSSSNFLLPVSSRKRRQFEEDNAKEVAKEHKMPVVTQVVVEDKNPKAEVDPLQLVPANIPYTQAVPKQKFESFVTQFYKNHKYIKPTEAYNQNLIEYIYPRMRNGKQKTYKQFEKRLFAMERI